MKTLIKIMGILAIITLAIPSNAQTVSDILSNETLRRKVMDSIAHNPVMSDEMMNAMMNIRHDNTKMREQNMMGMMMSRPNMRKKGITSKQVAKGSMMKRTEGDSINMMSMCQKMMEDPEMMKMMHNMMMNQPDPGNSKNGEPDHSSHHE